MRDAQYLAADCATGNGIAIMSNRISYFFDIHGPSMTIDTGCSASLICIHQAVQSLLNGESSVVSLVLETISSLFSGYVPGELTLRRQWLAVLA
jgi:acetyl-CoA acetyltransferase